LQGIIERGKTAQNYRHNNNTCIMRANFTPKSAQETKFSLVMYLYYAVSEREMKRGQESGGHPSLLYPLSSSLETMNDEGGMKGHRSREKSRLFLIVIKVGLQGSSSFLSLVISLVLSFSMFLAYFLSTYVGK